MKLNAFKAFSLFIGTLVLFWFAGFLWFTVMLFVTYAEPEQKSADAIIVLTGGQHRIEKGVELLKHEVAPKLLISGVNDDVKVRELVSDRPVPCCITLGYMARDTMQNGAETAEWIKDKEIKSVVLVTSHYHLPRAKIIFKHYLPDVQIRPYPVYPDNFEPETLVFWSTIFGEYNKMLLTWMRFPTFGAG